MTKRFCHCTFFKLHKSVTNDRKCAFVGTVTLDYMVTSSDSE